MEALDWRQRAIVFFATWLIRALFSTCRVRVIGQEWYDSFMANKTSTVGATWHRGALFLIWYWRKLNPMILTSRSRDGELVAGYARRLGAQVARGSSSRGGRDGLRAMARFFKQPGPRHASTVVDGPRGPRFEAKPGMVALAKMTGVPLVPVMMSAWPAITLKKTWDRTLIPLPFSRVTVVYGDPIDIPSDTNAEGLETYRRLLEGRLKQLMHLADSDTGYIQLWPIHYGPEAEPPGNDAGTATTPAKEG